ncbi:seryl-tRNA(Sec) selenium transferase [gamma proteobacterium HIMB55]|nr:seryl-tRNA(Sec) selenium transferase [gamma proteobacterium HIMB55]
MNDDIQAKLRELPSVSVVLDEMADDITQHGHQAVTKAVRAHLSLVREQLQLGAIADVVTDSVLSAVRQALNGLNHSSLVPVFNLTGIVLHSNLGRATLAESAITAMAEVASGASTLEYDIAEGKRGDRDSHIEAILCELTGAEAATVVNNNAAAVLLTLNTLALNKSVPVSRGELVEIGGSFRVPDIMSRSGCRLVEVGTTNRTHLADYADAIDADTALLMRVHTSNYRIEGFTKAVPESELAHLAAQHEIPFIVDMGCGNLIDVKKLGLPHEATAQDTLRNGADLVLFSGDKLLGGPQAGIIAGKKSLVAQIKKNPIKRALRLDKVTLAALEATLQLYRNPEALISQLPTLRLLTRSEADIQLQAERLCDPVTSALDKNFSVEVARVSSQIGSGSFPVEVLPSAGLSIASKNGEDAELRALDRRLHELPKPIIGRISNGALILDLRCLESDHEPQFLEQFKDLTL